MAVKSACRRRSETNDRLQAFQGGISHHGQGAYRELLIKSACVCPMFEKIKNQRSRSENPSPSPSQGHDTGVSVLHDIVVKRLHTRAVYPYALARLHAQIRKYAHRHTRAQAQRQAKNNNKHIRLVSRLWILFFTLLISMLPNSCNGAYANTYPRPHPNPNPASFNII